MQRLEVSGVVRNIYIYIIRRLKVKVIYMYNLSQKNLGMARHRWRDNTKMYIKSLASMRTGYCLTERSRCAFYKFKNFSWIFVLQSSG